jgi:hypothetical protein
MQRNFDELALPARMTAPEFVRLTERRVEEICAGASKITVDA